jgi:lipopolysaccharide export system protein LptA
MRRHILTSPALRGSLAALLLAGLIAPGQRLAAAPTVATKPASSTDKPPAKPGEAKASPTSKSVDVLGGATKSKDPIYITADRLDIYDKEGRAVYSGPSGVVATQGPSKLVGTELTAYYERQHDNGGDKQAGGPAPAAMGGSQVKRILVKGPVSVVQNDQVATGDNADFDRVQNIVILTGHVSLTQGPNVTTGDKLVYNLNSGVANVYSAPGTPVKSLFIQGSQASDPKAATPDKSGADKSTQGKSAQKPAPATPAKKQ